jgi:CRP/FNR family transcriptional regulator, cyclic AMP receptor protein
VVAPRGRLGVDPHLFPRARGNMNKMRFSGIDVIRLFEHDPDLLQGVDAGVAVRLRTRGVARRLWVPAGAWEPAFDERQVDGHLGLLVIDGFLVRTLVLAGRECSEIVGPGDVVRPWESDELDGSVECACAWSVLRPATFAVMDERLAAVMGRWPAIMSTLMARSARRSRSLVHQATIAHVRHAEMRLLLALWHLADRWGRVTPDGVVVPVPLTHKLLAQLTCLQRPTASSALGHLAADGRLSRRDDGGWTLHGAPPEAPARTQAHLTAA